MMKCPSASTGVICLSPPKRLPIPAAMIEPTLEEGRILTGCSEYGDVLRALHAAGPKLVVLTQDKDGATFSFQNTVLHAQGIDIPVVDPTGAGDTFAAALACCVAKGYTPEDAIRFCNCAGTLVCTKRGAIGMAATFFFTASGVTPRASAAFARVPQSIIARSVRISAGVNSVLCAQPMRTRGVSSGKMCSPAIVRSITSASVRSPSSLYQRLSHPSSRGFRRKDSSGMHCPSATAITEPLVMMLSKPFVLDERPEARFCPFVTRMFMQNFVLGEAVQLALRNGGDFQVTVVETPEQTAQMCHSLAANVLLMDVTSYPPCGLRERLNIRDEVKRRDPDCKIVFLVDENAEKKLAEEVKQAKRDGIIDLFLYGSISASYLVALLDTL